jgi:dTDP-4-amino-4,6-dideoxygalactose transaminase
MSERREIPISLPVTGEEEWQATRPCFETGWLTSGPRVREFEAAFAQRHQVKHAVAVTSATTALHLAVVALGIGPGDEVVVPAFTWVASANVVRHTGAEVVFCDVDPATYNLDPRKLKACLSERTKAIMVVHLFGLCADMDAIRAVSGDLPLIEDAACGAGAAYKGTPAGGLGAMGCFSFHPRKSVTTGEGGMLTTNDDALAETCGILRNHGASISEEQRHHGPRPYILPDFDVCGFNYRMTDLQAAVGVVQLGKLDGFIRERQQWADFYSRELADLDWLQTPRVPQGCDHGWQSYVTLVDEAKAPLKRNDLMEFLQERGISTRPGTHAVHMLSFYRREMGTQAEDFPGAAQCDRLTMAIPLHNRMVEEDYRYVVEALRSV